MEITLPIIVALVALGILQFVLGTIVGRLLLPGDADVSAADDLSAETRPGGEQLRMWTARLQRITDRLSGDVAQHQIRIEQITQDLSVLRHRCDDRTGDALLGRISDVQEANRHFSRRLDEVENALEDQAHEIADHIAQAEIDTDPELQEICNVLRRRMAQRS